MKTYHIVIGIRDNDNLVFSDLFIDNLKSAQKRFVKRILKLNKNVSKDDVEVALDEGYYSWNSCTIMYIEPMNIFSKKSKQKSKPPFPEFI